MILKAVNLLRIVQAKKRRLSSFAKITERGHGKAIRSLNGNSCEIKFLVTTLEEVVLSSHLVLAFKVAYLWNIVWSVICVYVGTGGAGGVPVLET